jgi:hypothetical protein
VDKGYRKIGRASSLILNNANGTHTKNAKPLKFHENQFSTPLQPTENFVQ